MCMWMCLCLGMCMCIPILEEFCNLLLWLNNIYFILKLIKHFPIITMRYHYCICIKSETLYNLVLHQVLVTHRSGCRMDFLHLIIRVEWKRPQSMDSDWGNLKSWVLILLKAGKYLCSMFWTFFRVPHIRWKSEPPP